jgi:hypothetical protein
MFDWHLGETGFEKNSFTRVTEITGRNSVTFGLILKKAINLYNIVTYRPTARQLLRKHIPAGTNEHNNRTFIARQRIRKQDFLRIERLCFLPVPCRGLIKAKRKSFELVVRS